MSTFPPVYNNRSTTLRSPHTPGDNTISVALGDGPEFGSVFPIRVTCQRVSDEVLCIFAVVSRSGDDLTVSGAIEGTTDISLGVGDVCEQRLTALTVTELQDSVHYSTATPTTSTVGGIPAGTSFTDELISDVIDQLLHAYLAPAFTSFAITGATTQEVGQTFSGSKTFTWATSNSGNVAANSIEIEDFTTSTTLGSSLANDGSEAFSISVSHNLPASHVWKITGTNSQASTFNTTTTVAWRWRLYYGTSVSITLTESAIEALAGSTLTTSFAATYSYAGGGYKYLCFPDSFGGPSSFKDQATQLNVAMCDSGDDPSYSNTENGFNYALVSVTNAFSQNTNYRVYRTKNILGGSINIIVS